LETFGLVPKGYFLLVARIEPENSILEIVEAFVEAHMNEKLVVLGKLEPRINRYHAKVQAAANGGVIFPGAIYDRKIVVALRFHCLAYMHGHQVGGTNPSLVEALGAGNPIIAHDNKFNRWAAGEEQLFFKNVKECSAAMRLASTSPASLERQSHFSREIHKLRYNLSDVHFSYLNVINDW
jgi:glycosyltransferase involved in cell wall biosynthesis